MTEDIIISCACSRLLHSVRFSYFPYGPHDKGDFEAHIEVIIDYDKSWWKRLKAAFFYLTGQSCKYLDISEVLIRNSDLLKLRTWVDKAEVDAAKRLEYAAKRLECKDLK